MFVALACLLGLAAENAAAAAPSKSLQWQEQPDAAVINTPVSSNGEFTPGPPWPSVLVLDNAGKPAAGRTVTVSLAVASAGSGLLAGTVTAVTDATGIATFTNLQITGAGTYRLSASTPGVATPAISTPFLVQTTAQPCGTASCRASLPAGGTQVDAQVDAGATEGFLSLSLNSSTVSFAPVCNGYSPIGSRWAVVLAPGGRTKSAVLTIPKSDMQALADNGAAHLEVCYATPAADFDPATVKAGTTQRPWDSDGDGVAESVAWVLATCATNTTTPRRPCDSNRKALPSGVGQITVLMPASAGDPAMRH